MSPLTKWLGLGALVELKAEGACTILKGMCTSETFVIGTAVREEQCTDGAKGCDERCTATGGPVRSSPRKQDLVLSHGGRGGDQYHAPHRPCPGHQPVAEGSGSP